MADTYIQFSILLDEVDHNEADHIWNRTRFYERNDVDTGWTVDYDAEKYTLWLYADTDGNVEAFADMLQDFIKLTGRDPITFTWSQTCSKPRPDEFTGGACLVEKDSIEFWNATFWAMRQIARLEAEAKEKERPKQRPESLDPNLA